MRAFFKKKLGGGGGYVRTSKCGFNVCCFSYHFTRPNSVALRSSRAIALASAEWIPARQLTLFGLVRP